MATAAEWVQGARPRTLGVAVAPVLVGTAAATYGDDIHWWRALGALVVSLAIQVGVNYANDYSDGVRGTDEVRRGPIRLTASKIATPAAVKRAAIISFAVAAVAGAWLSFAVNPWLLLLGAFCIVAAVGYTGGPKPYGYLGFGELMVLACFGFAATAGSAYVQTKHVNATTWIGCLVVGLPAVAILLCNNIRDIPTDRIAGKRTLAVRVGDRPARALYALSMVGTLVAVVAIGVRSPWALVALVAAPLAVRPVRIVWRAVDPPSLVRALVATVGFQLVVSLLLAGGLVKS
ncbi:MAG TPA: 1,4-dihydroxy-2-naphthoate polyprenyltransferase [Acidimicrobiia bacterium]|jgi:1,4-dihydroxy-2-naphthoate octaprenyltransferase